MHNIVSPFRVNNVETQDIRGRKMREKDVFGKEKFNFPMNINRHFKRKIVCRSYSVVCVNGDIVHNLFLHLVC